jgi:hypothetical protein
LLPTIDYSINQLLSESPVIHVDIYNTGKLINWVLQEDNNPSHGTKSKDNIANNIKKAN